MFSVDRSFDKKRRTENEEIQLRMEAAAANVFKWDPNELFGIYKIHRWKYERAKEKQSDKKRMHSFDLLSN